MQIIDGIRRLVRDYFASPEHRSSLENPATPLSYPAEWLLDIWNGGRTDSGVRVSAMTALQASVVFACVDLIAGTIGELPLLTYERLEVENKGHKRHARTLATDSATFDLLRYEPNPEMSAFTFKKTLQVHMLLWGNGYAEIERNGAGKPVALWPRNPAKTMPRRVTSNSALIYETTDGADINPADYAGDYRPQERRAILPENMIHVPGLSLDGRIGQDVVWLSRNAIGMTLATEKFASKFFANGAAPLGYLEYPQKLKPEDEEIAKRAWQEAYGGENRHRTALLQNGLKYTKIGSDASEAQMIEARKQQWLEIAPIFHVNPAMLGILRERGSNSEQIGLEFVNYTIGPWMAAWEDELKRKLFQPDRFGRNAGRTFFAKFDARKLTLPDAVSKKNFYSAGKQWGFLNSDDIREMEDMNPIGDGSGEEFWRPVNMVVNDSNESNDGQKPSEPAQQPDGGKQDPAAQNVDVPPAIAQQGERMFYPIFRDAVGRAITRSKKDESTLSRIFMPAVRSLADYFECEARTAELLKMAVRDATAWQAAEAEVIASAIVQELSAECRKKIEQPLFIARHGNTADDSKGLTSGRRDVPLDEQGKKEAQDLADYAANKLPMLAGIYAPNVKRHQQTAAIVAKATGAQVFTDDNLGPWDMGPELEGTPSDGQIEKYKLNPKATPSGGESLEDALNRTSAAIKSHLKMVGKTGQPRLLVMSHRSIRNFESKVSGSDVTENLHTGGLIKTNGEDFEQLH